MAPSSIIRFGPNNNNLSAQLLRNAITSSFEGNKVDDTTQPANDDCNKESNSPFVIQNKYFNAKIILKDINSPKEEELREGGFEDGIILVFDAVTSNPDRDNQSGSSNMAALAGSGVTFDSLQSTHQVSLSNNTCGDLLRLCVGVSLNQLSPSEIRGREHEKEYSRRILWCLDNGYEYIEADLSEAGKQRGHDCRDKDGYARVIEAIKGTVWSSAVMSRSKSSKLKESLADSRVAIHENRCNNSSSKNEETKQNGYKPNPPVSVSIDILTETTEQNEKEASKPKCNNMGQTRNLQVQDSITSLFGLKEGGEGMDPDDLDADKLFVEMESVLKEASQIRKASKSGILTDDERRERAGDAALALVNLMGKFGLDDNDDDSGDFASDDSGIIDSNIHSK